MKQQAFLEELFGAAVDAALPQNFLKAYLPDRPKGRTIVIGAGKGAAHLAQEFERLWDGPLTGIVVTRYGYAVPCNSIEILEASHPVPDQAGLEAGQKIIALLQDLSQDDLVVALVTGGGSALLPAPPEGLTLEHEIALNEALLASGAPIGVMNAIRKHASQIKGGRLAAMAHPAKVVSLIVSDIPGDVASQVASGPTVPDAVTANQALDYIKLYDMQLPEAVLGHIASEASQAPEPQDPAFAANEVLICASAQVSLKAAQAVAQSRGWRCYVLSDAIEGEAREVGKVLAAMAKSAQQGGSAFQAPCILLSGGEVSVTLNGSGKGGPNGELALSMALALDGTTGISALIADTDGIDGSEDNAGAVIDGSTAARIKATGTSGAEFLKANDSYTAFKTIGALFEPGPTGTNVNDFRAIIIEG